MAKRKPKKTFKFADAAYYEAIVDAHKRLFELIDKARAAGLDVRIAPEATRIHVSRPIGESSR